MSNRFNSMSFPNVHPRLLIGILILFYTVGTVGLLIPAFRADFLGLSPYNLVLTFAIAVLAYRKMSTSDLVFFAICYCISMLAEWIGTSTGWLFGSYYYGKNLGASIAGVPLVIGLNWWVLTVCSASISKRISSSVVIRSLIGASLMTLLDVLMEPVAIKSDFWHWKDELIPIYNYVCWFALSFLLHFAHSKLTSAASNKVFDVLFLILTLFFSIQLIF
jgi:putative membrane protein